MQSIYYHDYENDYPYFEMWQKYMKEYLEKTNTFELHIWNEETELIEFALKYGNIKDDPWKYGKIITGAVDARFIEMILSTAEKIYDGVFHKMTPFFSIFLDDIFESSHWGTEIHYK
ncbi:MAG: hypothetical protein E7218_08745 [Anaerofustis stercorihominis]|nr:hypothetical protein [Anaerofustis stercorihominis]